MPDQIEEEKNEQPIKEWNGFAGIRDKQEISLTKSDMPWQEDKDEDMWEEVSTTKGKMRYKNCDNATTQDLLSHYCGISSPEDTFESDDEDETFIQCFMTSVSLK